MEGRNCPNCNAPYDMNLNKCPFCDTSYFDLSSIDFDNGKPIYLKVKVNGMVITQKCVPYIGGITISNDVADIRGGIYDSKLCSVIVSRNMTTDVSFKGIADEKGTLFTIDTREGK